MNLVKTTVTIPEDIFKLAKITCVQENQTFSAFIRDALEMRLNKRALTSPQKIKKAKLYPWLGKFNLGITKIYNKRSDLYEEHLKRKMGF